MGEKLLNQMNIPKIKTPKNTHHTHTQSHTHCHSHSRGARFLPADDATLQYMISDQKFLNEISVALLEPQRPTTMRRSSSLNIFDHRFMPPPSRGRTSSLNFRDGSKLDVYALRKRPSERCFNEADEFRTLEWNFRKQDVDFPSSSVTASVSPKGKRCDPHYLDNPELLCRCISVVLKGYIESSADDEVIMTQRSRYDVFDGSLSNSNIEVIDLSSLMNLPSKPKSHMVNRKVNRKIELPSIGEIFQFIHTIYVKTQMESECLIIALVYIERALYGSENIHPETIPLACRTPSPSPINDHDLTDSPYSPGCTLIETLTLSSSNWKAIVVTSLLLASKIWDDFSMVNGDFAEICSQSYGCQLEIQRLNELEKSFLIALDYRVFVKGPEYSQVYFRLQNILDRLHSWLLVNNQHNHKRQKHLQSQQVEPTPSIIKGNIITKQRRRSGSLRRNSQERDSLENKDTAEIDSTHPLQLATIMSLNLFESIYSWIDEQLLSPIPAPNSPVPSTVHTSPKYSLPHDNSQNTTPSYPELTHSVPTTPYGSFRSSPSNRVRSHSIPITIEAPHHLPSLHHSVSASDLLGAMVLGDKQ